jgi:urocanate hydratase
VTALETARSHVDRYTRWIATDQEALQAALAAAERCHKAGEAEAAAAHQETARLCEQLIEVQRRLLAHWQVQLDRCQRIALARGEANGRTQASA